MNISTNGVTYRIDTEAQLVALLAPQTPAERQALLATFPRVPPPAHTQRAA